MAVTQALIEGSGWHLDRQGWRIVENFIVSDVNAGTNAAAMIPAAYQQLVQQNIDINLSHAIFTTAFCTDIEPAAIANDAVTFRVTYKEYEMPDPVIEISSSVAQVETDKNAAGVQQTTSYTYPSDYKWNTDLQGVTQTSTGLISKIMPEPAISISRREMPVGGGRELIVRKLIYEGHVNMNTWGLVPDSSEPKTWLCTGIGARTQDRGITYDVTYNFQYRADTWDHTIRFLDPGTGQPPSDLVEGTGYKDVQVYLTADFNLLNLV